MLGFQSIIREENAYFSQCQEITVVQVVGFWRAGTTHWAHPWVSRGGQWNLCFPVSKEDIVRTFLAALKWVSERERHREKVRERERRFTFSMNFMRVKSWHRYLPFLVMHSKQKSICYHTQAPFFAYKHSGGMVNPRFLSVHLVKGKYTVLLNEWTVSASGQGASPTWLRHTLLWEEASVELTVD